MKFKRALALGVIIVVVLGSFSVSWSGEIEGARVEDIVDLVVLRPVGGVATLAGTGLFLLTLPFTVPTHSVNEAAERFVVVPFRYTFSRPFPDPNL